MTTAEALIISAILFVGAILGIGLMSIGWHYKKQSFAYGAVSGWLIIAGVGFSTSGAVGDLYFMVGWFGVGLSAVAVMEALALKEKDEEKQEKTASDYAKAQGYGESIEEYRKRTGAKETKKKPPPLIF